MVDHDYEFGAREHKWRWLERNRLGLPRPRLPGARCWCCWRRRCSRPSWRCSPSRSPAAGAGRSWRANLEALRWLPRLLRERRQVQATRTVSAAEFASWLTPDLDSPFISAAARSLPARLALRAYWRSSRLLASLVVDPTWGDKSSLR